MAVKIAKKFKDEPFSAWNPGIESEIPDHYAELETIYHPEYTTTTLPEVKELTRETGLSGAELVVFRPERLALHEVIIRITADIAIFETENEEDYGINFREVAHKILEQYIQPGLTEIEACYQRMREQIETLIDKEISETLFAGPKKAPTPKRFWSFFKSKKTRTETPAESLVEKEFRVIASFKEKGLKATDRQSSATYRSLYRVLGAIANKRGFLGRDRELLVELCTRHACNFLGGRLIGKIVHNLILQAISDQGYQLTPEAENSILISLKGTSAAGKSSLRPRLLETMNELGLVNGKYGTISPDIWRRLLLDYDSLHDAYKYAGRLTSYEVNIIDSKLDQYIRGKAQKRQAIPHLMVDRFRFDSFASDKVSRVLHKTYVKYIDTMYMYFVIIPPEATVERGWKRGLDRGRYKSVEDFLGHSVEAYEGIPKLLFKYLSNSNPRYVFEFLNNDVPFGSYPLPIARGSQSHMDIFDPMGFVNIVRYQKINVLARNKDEVYEQSERFKVGKNLDFLNQCIARLEHIRFIDPDSNLEYIQVNKGRLLVTEKATYERIISNPELRIVFESLSL